MSPAAFLAAWPAGRSERRLALWVVLGSFVAFALAVPFAKRPLPQIWAFIPIYEAALVINDLITVLLLFGQFRIARSKALLMLGSGYFFTALITAVHGLSFPGLFTPGGLLGSGPQTTVWLYLFWHGGFPLFVAGYALLRGTDRDALPVSASSGRAIVAAMAGVVTVVVAMTVLVTAGHDALPILMMPGHRFAPALFGNVVIVWLASLFALLVLQRHRRRSVLDLWLMVVLCAWLFDIALSAMLNGARFDLGFYAGRAYGLLAGSFVLGVLLLENGVLHARLIDSHAHAHQRALDLQNLSERLETSNTQLLQQTRLKSEFLANMSHELRTPLNAVIGFSDLLKAGMAKDDLTQRRFATHIFQAGHHLLALINDILDLSKIEAGKVEIQLEAIDLATALADAKTLLAPQAANKQLRVQIDAGEASGVLLADRRGLKQILLNLMSNAMKFTPEGGLITLQATVVDRERAMTVRPGFADGMRMPLATVESARYAEISVSDTGIGMAATDLQRLFEPFVQIPNALARDLEGTGLGLVMVHRLAQLQGGAVAVTSAQGRGSCFTVWLPWRENTEAIQAIAAPASSPVRSTSHPLALIVEDNAQAAALMRVQLETEGFKVQCVTSAKAALAFVDQITPDLITLDILLPDMDGWELLVRLKESPAWPVPVVVVSVVADRGKGFSLGAALVLQKPITRETLSKGLERLGLRPGQEHDVTVLVIDDDPGAVDLLAKQLGERDFKVLRALGGQQGIDLAQRHTPDLIALDLEMPDVNGFHVVEALKGSPSTAQIPIMVVTAKDLNASDRKRLNGHVLDIVGKADFNHGSFMGEVQRALSKVG